MGGDKQMVEYPSKKVTSISNNMMIEITQSLTVLEKLEVYR